MKGERVLNNSVTATPEYVKGLLPKRPCDANKGSFGKALLICGSRNMCGCAVLSAMGALKSGAGLVTLAFPDVLYTPVLSQLRECVFLPLETAEDGGISASAKEVVLNKARESDCVLFGCGVGVTNNTSELLCALVTKQSTPLVIDADGLNIISKSPEILKERTCPVLLTPHPGEMSRLTGFSISELQTQREKTAYDFCEKYGVTLLLKGAGTLICESGREIIKNPTGNTGLSKGGSGDLLSGIITGLVASGKMSFFDGAVLGAYLHGLCADILKDSLTEYAMLPSDCANAIPEAFKRIIG